jgi:drug/metabolite transporter (DMT)-like permease
VTSRRASLLATGALLFTTASWGSTFFLIKDLLHRMPTLDFLAVRFTIAGVVTLVVMHRAVLALDREAWRRAAVLGLVYGVAQILQTAGLAHTAASVSGFITGMYVVCTPVLASLILRSRITRGTWGAVALATLGLGVLTLDLPTGGGSTVGYGEALTFVASVLYALHIVALGAWSTARDALGMSVVQLLVIALVCLVATAPDGIVLPHRSGDWWAVIYMALVAGALGLAAQTWAQSQLSATRTAIIMSMEPVFAALFAVLLGGEGLTGRMLVGGALVLTAMLVVEVGPRRKVEGEVQHLAV